MVSQGIAESVFEWLAAPSTRASDTHLPEPYATASREVQLAVSSCHEQPNSRARSNARRLLQLLYIETLCPTRVIASGEGGIAFTFESQGRYADFECFNDGSVMWGLTDFADRSEVNEVFLSNHVEIADACKAIKLFVEPG